MNKHLHIIAHDIPWPAHHGGLMDLYYKIRTLSGMGLLINLHCFYKGGLNHHKELEDLCESVHYYKRKKKISLNLPYIVSSRSSDELRKRLLEDDYPILLEGIHCTALLSDAEFENRKMVVRLHNVEHVYYRRLFELEEGIRKIYYKREAESLQKYERAISGKAFFLAVSEEDCRIYREEFGAGCEFLPVFHPWKLTAQEGFGSYYLYHGNLAINENEKAAIMVLESIDPKYLVIAGKDPSGRLVRLAGKLGARLVANPSEEKMEALIRNAHINILPSFNHTGVKLKILNALFNGRHCITNIQGVAGSGLEGICEIAEAGEWRNKVDKLMKVPFSTEMINKRQEVLLSTYDNTTGAKKLIAYLY